MRPRTRSSFSRNDTGARKPTFSIPGDSRRIVSRGGSMTREDSTPRMSGDSDGEAVRVSTRGSSAAATGDGSTLAESGTNSTDSRCGGAPVSIGKTLAIGEEGSHGETTAIWTDDSLKTSSFCGSGSGSTFLTSARRCASSTTKVSISLLLFPRALERRVSAFPAVKCEDSRATTARFSSPSRRYAYISPCFAAARAAWTRRIAAPSEYFNRPIQKSKRL